jgi:hypothetical protein
MCMLFSTILDRARIVKIPRRRPSGSALVGCDWRLDTPSRLLIRFT